MERLRVREAVVVEGRYDKAALSGVLDALIVEVGGFGIFSDEKKQRYLRLLAEERGVILLTDSDPAGRRIRGFLKGILPRERVKNAFIPRISGVERRKRAPSSAGFLGVEGVGYEALLTALSAAGVTAETSGELPAPRWTLTRAELYTLGLIGAKDSASRRAALCQSLGLPPDLSVSELVALADAGYSEERFRTALEAQATADKTE